MELQQVTLDGVGEIRRSFFEHRALPFLVKSTASGDDTSRFSYAKRRRSQDKERLQRASAVDRMMLMVQVAEAVTWLHQEMNIVHKDPVSYTHLDVYKRQPPTRTRVPEDAGWIR